MYSLTSHHSTTFTPHLGRTQPSSVGLSLLPTCPMATALAAEPSAMPQIALVQLLEHVHSVLISLMSYELQTPLSTLQIAVETLAEGETVPAQVQRRMIKVAVTELKRLCSVVDVFLSYAKKVLQITLEFLQAPSEPMDVVNAIFSSLPQELEQYRPWIAALRARLSHFIQIMAKKVRATKHVFTTHQIALLEQRQRQILAIVKHEWSTPLATLQICLDTVQYDDLPADDAQHSILELACSELQRLCDLVRDLELLRRLEIGQVSFRTELVDLRSTLQTTLNSFLKQASKNILSTIHLEFPPRLSMLWADGDRLVEVITRLLENACRFTDETGEVRIKVTSQAMLQNGSKSSNLVSALQISITDTGCGISAEQLDQVFDCFHQEEGYLQRTNGGIGIGLTICRYLVEGMGGQIWAESAGKHQGSEFCFTLPVYQAAIAITSS